MLKVSEKAVARVNEFWGKNPEAKGKPFRVALQPGGCSGYMYDFSFDEKKDKDLVIEEGGVIFVLDPNSAALLKNSTLDFVSDGFMGGSFQCVSPDASEACGCGKSVGFAAPAAVTNPFAAAFEPKPEKCS